MEELKIFYPLMVHTPNPVFAEGQKWLFKKPSKPRKKKNKNERQNVW